MPDLVIDATAEEDVRARVAEMAAHAKLGEECARFKRGRVYAWLIECAEADAAAAVRELRACDPSDPKKIAALQIQAARADDFRRFVERAVERGQHATAALHEIAA